MPAKRAAIAGIAASGSTPTQVANQIGEKVRLRVALAFREAIAAIGKGNPTLGTLAALQLAKAQAESGKRDDAIATLRNLRDVDADLRPIVRQRLARLLIDAGKAKEALPLLDDDKNPSMLDVRGDARFALGELVLAQKDYMKALGLVDVGDPEHRLLTLKLIEAGGTPPHTEDKT